MDVVTLLKVGALGKTGHGLQWWSLPQEQRKSRFLPLLDLSRASVWTRKYQWDGLEKLIGDLCLLQKRFQERAECFEMASASVKGQEVQCAWGGAPQLVPGGPPVPASHIAGGVQHPPAALPEMSPFFIEL